jgi:hypothetical protein
MQTKVLIVAALMAFAEARFSQEGLVQSAVQALSDRGSPGAAGTDAGQTPGVLLAGANACAKLTLADKIVKDLGNTADVIAAAQKLVAAEKNFNPSAQSIPTICSDATLPVTLALRGITPLIDPAVVGADVANALSAQTLKAPLANNAGKSIADLLKLNGFSNFTAQAAA